MALTIALDWNCPGISLSGPRFSIIVRYQGTRSFERKMLSGRAICGMLVDCLAARRTGAVAADRPIGLLSHHLVFGEEEWCSMGTLLDYLGSHPAVTFLRADQLFPEPSQPLSTVTASPAADITVVITSCGRQDLLEQTLDSFLECNTYPIREFVVMEDGQAEKNRLLEAKYQQHPFRWLSTGKRVGQIASIDAAYRRVEK